MQVLVELSAHVGEVVPKEDLIRSVWPNTAVGDDVLIRCICELRHVFNDNARAPKVIQTISKMGYRLIAPVTAIPAEAPPKPVDLPPRQDALVQPEVRVPATPPTTPDNSALVRPGVTTAPNVKQWLAVAAAVLLLAVIAVWAFRPKRSDVAAGSMAFKTVPFTSYPGAERQPAFSPDGNQIVFTWNGDEAGDSRNLYVKLIGSEIPLRLTHADAEDMSPAWSPDGKTIAFIRRSLEGNGIYLVPAIGGPERKIYDLHCAIDWDEPGLSWSPDGKQLIFPDGKSESNPSSIFALSLDTLNATQLTHPKNSWDGDFSPAFSPDGKHIAFVRGTDVGSRGVYVMNVSGNDEPRRLTFDTQQLHGLTWTRDGSAVVFSSDAGGTAALWRVPVSGGTAQRLPFGSEKAFSPVISPAGNRLAYSQGADSWSLMRIDMKVPRAPAVRLISSNEQDSAPKFSHDGKYVAFQSLRSGSQEIWISSADSAAPVKLTSFNGPLTGSPSWSPDDTQVAFDSRVKGQSHIFVMSARGGEPRQLTNGEFNDIIPNWSADGKSIYFSSRRNGSWQIWKISLESGQMQQITQNGGFVAQESPDGKWIYYTKYNLPGLWRLPVAGGNEVKVLDNPPPGYWAYFSTATDGVYFLRIQGSKATINFYDSARATSSELYELRRRPALFSGLSVSPDGRWILYTDALSRDGDIVLVENFH
jgi:Tol biopolymer transport system component